MIKPNELESATGQPIWEALSAAARGDAPALRRLLGGGARLARAEYWYTPPIHFAAREGHLEAVEILLEAGAHPEWNGLHDVSLIEMARERGHAAVARVLEQARDRRGIVRAGAVDHPIHAGAARGDVSEISRLLDLDSSLVDIGDASGASPLHVAAREGRVDAAAVLLDRGARVHAFQGAARGLAGGIWRDLQAIDLAIWGRGSADARQRLARLLVDRGATCDLTIAAALGDAAAVTRMLDADPGRVSEARPSGLRPLTAAVQQGHAHVARLLLQRGADPTWEEPTAPGGLSLYEAVKRGDRRLVELLLAHGADPNGTVDSSGSATFAARDPAIRALLEAHGGTLEPYLIWIDEDDEAMRRIAANPRSPCLDDAFTTVCTQGKRELLRRLLDSGVRVPAVLTGCQSYLLHDVEMLRTLLAHGMSPDLPNWQHQTLLHRACDGPDDAERKRACAALLLDAGASLTARDEEYRSTPLAWAARTNAQSLVEFLLARGAPVAMPDDEPWATPLAWAERRGHAGVASRLRARGAVG